MKRLTFIVINWSFMLLVPVLWIPMVVYLFATEKDFRKLMCGSDLFFLVMNENNSIHKNRAEDWLGLLENKK